MEITGGLVKFNKNDSIPGRITEMPQMNSLTERMDSHNSEPK